MIYYFISIFLHFSCDLTPYQQTDSVTKTMGKCDVKFMMVCMKTTMSDLKVSTLNSILGC